MKLNPSVKFSAVAILLSNALSSSLFANEPAWVQQPSRTMDNGYIVYVGTGSDVTQERARFKAKSMAVQMLVNECTLPHKETRIEDYYDDVSDGQYQSYAKVAIQYTDCDEGKQALTPSQIKRLTNPSLAEEQKRYNDMLYGDPDKNQKEIAALKNQIAQLSDSVDEMKDRQDLAEAKQKAALTPDVYGPEDPAQFAQVVLVTVPRTISLRRHELKNPKLLPWQRSIARRGLGRAYSYRSSLKGTGIHLPRTYVKHGPRTSHKTFASHSKPRKMRSPASKHKKKSN